MEKCKENVKIPLIAIKEWYNYKEIVQLFGICKQTLNNWRKTGIIQYKKITKRTFLYKLPDY